MHFVISKKQLADKKSLSEKTNKTEKKMERDSNINDVYNIIVKKIDNLEENKQDERATENKNEKLKDHRKISIEKSVFFLKNKTEGKEELKKQKILKSKNEKKRRKEESNQRKLDKLEAKMIFKEGKSKKGLFKKKIGKKEEIENQSEEIADVKITEHVENEVYERKGFGWKGLGARRIYFDNKRNEYCYDVIEPELGQGEKRIKDKIIYFFRIRADLDAFNLEERDKKKYLQKNLEKIIREKFIRLKGESKDKVFYYIFQEFIGYCKIDILMHDEGIEDISCDGVDIPIFIFHKKFESIRTNIIFNDSDELDSFVVKLSQMCGKQISVYEPVVDGRLEDGSRLQTTLARTITKYSTFTIRRFREDPLTPIDLINNNTMSIDMATYFWLVIEKGTSILFCGGTASGKTTALNALSLFLPSTFKIVSIEDTREINLPHENWIAGTTRTGFTATEDLKTGKDIDMFDLIRVALRQRPKVIIVGEVRGKEAYTLFQAMTTGHLSYSTIHASDMHTLIQRLENKPIDLPRALLTSLDLIVFLNSLTVRGDNVRRITNVTEIIKLDPETNRLVTITPYHWMSEINDNFESTGGSGIIDHLKLQYGWNSKQFNQEFKNRKAVLKWMIKKNLRTYEDVGRIISEYAKDSKDVMKKVLEDK